MDFFSPTSISGVIIFTIGFVLTVYFNIKVYLCHQ